MSIWQRVTDTFRSEAVTIPPLDGAFKPNDLLDSAETETAITAPDSIVVAGGLLWIASGPHLTARPLAKGANGTGRAEAMPPAQTFGSDITAIAALEDGALAVALASGEIRVAGGAHDGRVLRLPDGVACITAMTSLSPGQIVATSGSTVHAAADWANDLMGKGTTGSVWRLGLAGGPAVKLAGNLAFPSGVAPFTPGAVVVSEAWTHRLLAVTLDGAAPPKPLLSRLPGYPGRISAAAGGGYWLALFAPRNRLVEFVLQEDAYRAEMMATIDRSHWIAPALSSGRSFLEPLQCGGVVTMGILKPWSPVRSYGLAARLGRNLQPLTSLHSRADGRVHGITAIAEAQGDLLLAAKGADAIVRVSGAASGIPGGAA